MSDFCRGVVDDRECRPRIGIAEQGRGRRKILGERGGETVVDLVLDRGRWPVGQQKLLPLLAAGEFERPVAREQANGDPLAGRFADVEIDVAIRQLPDAQQMPIGRAPRGHARRHRIRRLRAPVAAREQRFNLLMHSLDGRERRVRRFPDFSEELIQAAFGRVRGIENVEEAIDARRTGDAEAAVAPQIGDEERTAVAMEHAATGREMLFSPGRIIRAPLGCFKLAHQPFGFVRGAALLRRPGCGKRQNEHGGHQNDGRHRDKPEALSGAHKSGAHSVLRVMAVSKKQTAFLLALFFSNRRQFFPKVISLAADGPRGR